jgi:hypothetical protein
MIDVYSATLNVPEGVQRSTAYTSFAAQLKSVDTESSVSVDFCILCINKNVGQRMSVAYRAASIYVCLRRVKSIGTRQRYIYGSVHAESDRFRSRLAISISGWIKRARSPRATVGCTEFCMSKCSPFFHFQCGSPYST